MVLSNAQRTADVWQLIINRTWGFAKFNYVLNCRVQGVKNTQKNICVEHAICISERDIVQMA